MDRWVRSPRPPSGGGTDEREEPLGLVETEDGACSDDEEEELEAVAAGNGRGANGNGGSANGNGNGHGPALPSTLHLFLNEIGRYRLLTAAEEVELAKLIERGDRAARERMITSNLRLVVAIAKRHRIPEASGLSLLDLIQEGCIGLIRAVELFDWRTGNRFSTYASFWIRQSVVRCLMLKGHAVRMSAAVHRRLRAVAKAEQELRTRLGREPTEAEVAKLAGLAPEELTMLRLRTVTLSLDQTADDGGSPLGELIPGAADVVEDVDARMSADVLHSAVSELPARLRKLIVLRYGMAGQEPHSLAEIGRHFGLTRERVRQLERRALDELAESVTSVRGDRGKLGRALGRRLSAFDPGALVSALKSALAASASTNVASSVAIVAAAGVIAPTAVTLGPLELSKTIEHKAFETGQADQSAPPGGGEIDSTTGTPVVLRSGDLSVTLTAAHLVNGPVAQLEALHPAAGEPGELAPTEGRPPPAGSIGKLDLAPVRAPAPAPVSAPAPPIDTMSAGTSRPKPSAIEQPRDPVAPAKTESPAEEEPTGTAEETGAVVAEEASEADAEAEAPAGEPAPAEESPAPAETETPAESEPPVEDSPAPAENVAAPAEESAQPSTAAVSPAIADAATSDSSGLQSAAAAGTASPPAAEAQPEVPETAPAPAEPLPSAVAVEEVVEPEAAPAPQSAVQPTPESCEPSG